MLSKWCFHPKEPSAVGRRASRHATAYKHPAPAARIQAPTHKPKDVRDKPQERIAQALAAKAPGPGNAPLFNTDPATEALAIRQVATRVFCGPRPTPAMMDKLKTLGIKTIINLEDYHTYWGWFGWQTRTLAAQSGITMVRQPMSPIFQVSRSRVKKIVDLLGDADRAPFYVHCLYGKERTNLVVALHRRAHEALPINIVQKAMYEEGFRPYLVPLLAVQAGELLQNPAPTELPPHPASAAAKPQAPSAPQAAAQ